MTATMAWTAPRHRDGGNPDDGSPDVDPLTTLHHQVLRLALTPARHDPVTTLYQVSTVLREMATDALTQRIPIHRWIDLADLLSASGELYRDVARERARRAARLTTGVVLRCRTCGTPTRRTATFSQAVRVMEAHANLEHRPSPPTAGHHEPITTVAQLPDPDDGAPERSATGSLVTELVELAQQLHTVGSGLLNDDTDYTTLLTPIQGRILCLRPALVDLAPAALEMLDDPTSTQGDAADPATVAAHAAAARDQLIVGLQLLGVACYPPEGRR